MKKIDDYSKLEFLSLNQEEQLRLINEESKKEDERIIRFWKVEYPNKTEEEKAKYWAGGLFQSMRWQEESNLNPYSIYSESWLKETLNLEPNFMKLLPIIYNVWGGMFDAGKVDRIIQRHFKNLGKNK